MEERQRRRPRLICQHAPLNIITMLLWSPAHTNTKHLPSSCFSCFSRMFDRRELEQKDACRQGLVLQV